MTPPATSCRTLLVTGASKGIGAAIARQLAADGFDIVVHCHTDETGARQTAAAINATTKTTPRLLQFDVTKREQTAAAIEADIEAHGPYYGIVHNAGITADAAFPATTAEDWDSVLRTNLDSFYNVIHPALTPMIAARQGGRILTLSSVSGLVGNRGQVNYSAAKAGIIGATKALAIELARRKITVNCIAPGLIQTNMLKLEPAVFDEALRLIPAQRLGTPEEVAALASFLISDNAAYITRQVISINGGMI
ncbi:MAG: 3-ketoacyl-ACP reductase FabG2 [Puniceicoccales bacterium]|jgi:3-oxoacyl-[acyl-carrier protein] reductase|nr:3-ketoacyl-ACP reductase FabG2 [Puniceicoccales bacterium]